MLWGGSGPDGTPRADVLNLNLGTCAWAPLCFPPPERVAPHGLLLHMLEEVVVAVGGTHPAAGSGSAMAACSMLRLADTLQHTAFEHCMRIEVWIMGLGTPVLGVSEGVAGVVCAALWLQHCMI